jgi:AraC-like DNA-binding protein
MRSDLSTFQQKMAGTGSKSTRSGHIDSFPAFFGETILDGFVPEQMVETLQGSNLEHVQLEDGRFHGRLIHLRESRWRLDYGEYTVPVLARGQLPNDLITLGFLEDSPTVSTFNGLAAEGGALVMWSEGAEIHTRLSGGCKWACIQVRREALDAAGIDLPLEHHATFRLDKYALLGLGRGIMDCIRAWGHRADSNHPPVTGELSGINAEDAFISAVSRCWAERKYMRSPLGAKRARKAIPIIRRFEDYVDAHLAEPLTISQVCFEISYPLHSLERLCLELYQITPKQFLSYRRLSALRDLLLSHTPDDMTVAKAAMACGLNHLGRAAAMYQRTFGEKPSTTLRAAQR